MQGKLFKDPGKLYRNAPFWSMNDRLDKEEMLRQMDEMTDKGWGSFFIHTRVGLITSYLSDEWFDLTKACVEHAKETDSYVWLYDEDKWPSGFAGGLVSEQDAAYRNMHLMLLDKDKITPNDTVLKVHQDVQGSVYICKRLAPLGNKQFNGASYVDLMNPKAVEAFLESTHEKYKDTCGDYFGKEIPGVFTDEPCYIMKNQYKEPTVPWSEYLPDYFESIKGYSIMECLEQLFFDIGDYQKTRFDFYDTATKLFIESFTKQYYNWCDDNNLKFTGHFMAEDSHSRQTNWIGAAMPHYEFMHWPGVDKLRRNIQQLVTVKQLTSVTDQLGKERGICEVFGCIGQQSNFFHRKWISDWQAVLGISFVNSHLSLYSMRGERKRDYPANLFVQQPWWEDEKKFADYTGRLCVAVTQGEREVDILVLHTIASFWCEYSPLHIGGDVFSEGEMGMENERYDVPFQTISHELINNKLDFHYGDEIIMENHAKVENGKLVIGKHAYSTVIVPPMLTIRENTLKLLKEFAVQAGPENLIFINELPKRIDGGLQDLALPKGIIEVASEKDAIRYLDSVYQDRIHIRDRETGEKQSHIICHKRNTDEGAYYLLANTLEEGSSQVDIIVASDQEPYLVDLMSGDSFRIPFTKSENKVTIECTIHAAGSMLLYLPVADMDVDPVPAYVHSGVSFNWEHSLLDTLGDWKTHILEDNVLPINDISLYVEGEKVLDQKNAAYAWHEIFGKLEEGTMFKAEYRFDIKDVPNGALTAVIEVAENLDRIMINGIEAKALKEKGQLGCFDELKSWKDINFTRVPIGGMVKQGENVITIEGRKFNNITAPGCHRRVEDYKEFRPTEIEAIYIVGDFRVINDSNQTFSIGVPGKDINAGNICEDGYEFYAGSVDFTCTTHIKLNNDKTYLKLNDVNAATIKLFVNDQFVDLLYMSPYVFDISEHLKDGLNEIRVVGTNTLFNLMGPNWVEGIEELEFVTPRTFVDFDSFTNEYKILPFGIGKAELLSTKDWLKKE